MSDISFVFDRTDEDLAIASNLRNKVMSVGYEGLYPEEKILWRSNLKGCRNTSDLNRIGNACNVISDILYNANIIPTLIVTKDDWTISEIPTANDIKTILDNIEVFRSAVLSISSREYPPYIEDVPRNPINTIEKMNSVERILYEVYNIANIILTDRQVCGEGYTCADDRLI